MKIGFRPMRSLWSIAALVAAVALTSCKDSPTGPPAVATVVLTVPSLSAIAGTSQQLSVVVKAANGAVLTDRHISWTTLNPNVSTVSSTGVLVAAFPGTTTVFATVEGKSASSDITVLPVPVASVTVAPQTVSLLVNAGQQLTAILRDATGSFVDGRVVTWTSGDVAVAAVSSNGLVTAVAMGTATITATSEGKTGTATVSVAARGTPPLVTSIAPATLVPGTIATISGLRFDTLPAGNTVLVRGVSAQVLSANSTQLSVILPCVNSGDAEVTVSVAGSSSPVFIKPVIVASRSLSVGQSIVLTNNAESVCNELATSSATARYLVTVFSASTSQNVLVNFEIGGNTPTPGSITKVVTSPPIPGAAVQSHFESRPPADAQDDLRDDAHWRMLERDRAQYEALRAKAQHIPRALHSLRAAALPVVGELRDFFFTFSAGCNSTSTPMHTKAIYAGTRSIIWEDAENTLQSAANPALLGFYQRLGQIFEQDQYESLKANFGDPLLRDAQTDADGRVHMVFSQKLNNTGAAAFVTSCDQFPRTISAGSNFGEVFYGSVPTTAGTNLNSTLFPDGWFYFMARTVVHEVKHIVSVAARVQNNSPSAEQSWLEEGTARHAEELWARESLHHVSWKANTGFGSAATNGVYCDFHPSDATCNAADPLRRPSYGMRRQFNEIREKLLAPWDWSPYGDASTQTGSVFYQTTWSLVRYTIDRYAASEPGFFRALINSQATGTANLSAVAGVPMDQLIGGWGLALFADDYPGLNTSNADLQFQTWNLRNIYQGLNASPSWFTRFPTVFPIQPVQLSFGSFTSARSGLRGGAHSYYELSGSAPASQLIALRAIGGTTPSSNLRIAIARLQ